MALVEAYGPDGVGPCADEQGSGCAVDQRAQELATDAAVLVRCADVGVTDQEHAADGLDAHGAHQSA